MNLPEKVSESIQRVEPGHTLDSGKTGIWMGLEDSLKSLLKSRLLECSSITKFKAGDSIKKWKPIKSLNQKGARNRYRGEKLPQFGAYSILPLETHLISTKSLKRKIAWIHIWHSLDFNKYFSMQGTRLDISYNYALSIMEKS